MHQDIPSNVHIRVAKDGEDSYLRLEESISLNHPYNNEH